MTMSGFYQCGVFLLLFGWVQCKQQVFNNNDSLVINPDLQKTDEPLFTCNLCKKILQKVFSSVGKELSKDSVNLALKKVCQKLKLIAGPCQRLVNKYKDKLVTVIMSAKNAPEACKQLKLCNKHNMSIYFLSKY